MATWQEHQAKAQDNEIFGAGLSLDDQAGIEWATTSFFYSSLHYIEAFLAKLPVSPPHHNHKTRNAAVASNTDLRTIWAEYQDLTNLSQDARYRCKAMTKQKFKDRYCPALATVKAHIMGLL